MQQFYCPFCGPREQSEFTYLREVAAVPALDAGGAAWYSYVYGRSNACGAHAEWWQHQHGCRQVLHILRDTLSHEVLDIRLARPSQGQA